MNTSSQDSSAAGPRKNLCDLIARRQVVAVVGSGVSAAVTQRAPTASWQGLLSAGIAHCEQFVPGLPRRWGQRQRDSLEDALQAGDLVELLAVAEQVSQRLGAPLGGEYVGWLRQSLCAETLPLRDDAVIRALAALDVPLVTTNYDDLIERVTGLPGVTWQQRHKIPRVLRGEDRAVLHLHGKWDEPASVILGIRDYESVKSDEHTQAVMHALGITRSLLLVGCGEGLKDPNFATFFQWLGRVHASSEYRNYRLARSSEAAELQRQHPPEQRVLVLPYGEQFADLPGFLDSLRPPPSAGAAPARSQTPLSPALDAYLRQLCAEHGRLPLIGMGAGLQIDLPISDAYVPLRACYMPAREGRGRFDLQAFQEGEHTERDVRLEDVFRRAGRGNKRGVLMLGDPGAGKTTGARQLCWRVASGQDAPDQLGLPPGTLPVFIRLRNVRPDDMGNGLQALIVRETELDDPKTETSTDRPDQSLSPFTELWGFAGSLLWIFDGLDEVVDEDTRATVCAWLVQLLQDRPRDRVLVTSRYQGYEGKVDLGETFVRFEVQPLDEVQAGTFVYTWFRVAYERLELTPDAAKEKARALVELLGQPAYRIGRMAELRSNPLLLTILCLVYHEDASLPRSRVRLYERCVKVLLETWRQQVHTQHGGRPYNPDAARQVLSSVAWWMHEEDNRRSVPLADMEARAAVTLQQFPNSGLGTDGREFLRLMREDSGIVAASGAGYAEFLHLTFQEYLAALYAVQHNSAAELAGAVGASWWQEVILLALAQGTPAFSEGFFDALLQGKTLEEHADFVTRCLQESEPLVAEPFVRQLRNTKTPLRRKLAVLRQLRTYGFPDLLDICRGWTEHSNRELSALTREILERAGQRLVPAEATAVEVAPAEFVDEKTGIAFVRIRAGEFPMGDETREWSKPIHKVRITRDFYLGKYPVTNEEYARFLDATQYNPPSQWNERRFNQPRQPVVGVSWDDAQAFCQWAGCRLPTEAEWEYGCRAGRTTAFSFGDDEKMLTEFAWYDQNSNSQTQPVGSKTPNPWGLYDMHGNVWEWCQDFFNDEYYRDSPQDDPPGAAEPQVPKSWGWAKVWERPRVLRGGSWQSAGVSCRSGDRCAGLPAGRNVGVGLRVVRPRSSQPVAGGARPA